MDKKLIMSNEYNPKIKVTDESKLENCEVNDSWEATVDENNFINGEMELVISSNHNNWLESKNNKDGDIFFIAIDNAIAEEEAYMEFNKDIAKELVKYLTEKLNYIEESN